MRVMMIRMADALTEAGVLPTTDMIDRMGDYAQAMMDAGVLIGGDGLKPSSASVRVRFKAGVPTVIDGPFTESKELIGGYFMLRVESFEDAVEWAKRWPVFDGDGNVQLELRPLYENEDFGPEFTAEQRAAEDAMRAEWAKASS